MAIKKVKINWPNKQSSFSCAGEDWIKAASEVNVHIPTGCLSGSCGACEIEVNGEVIRACIKSIPDKSELNVQFFSDPYW